MPKAVNHSGFCDKHNSPQRDSIPGPRALQSDMLPLDHCDLLDHNYCCTFWPRMTNFGMVTLVERSIFLGVQPSPASPNFLGPYLCLNGLTKSDKIWYAIMVYTLFDRSLRLVVWPIQRYSLLHVVMMHHMTSQRNQTCLISLSACTTCSRCICNVDRSHDQSIKLCKSAGSWLAELDRLPAAC